MPGGRVPSPNSPRPGAADPPGDITEATTAGGRSRAQASAQLARGGRKATADLVLPFAVSAESDDVPAELVAHLVCSPEAVGLAGS